MKIVDLHREVAEVEQVAAVLEERAMVSAIAPQDGRGTQPISE